MSFLYRSQGCCRADNSSRIGHRHPPDSHPHGKEYRAGNFVGCRVERDKFLLDCQSGNDVDKFYQRNHACPEIHPQREFQHWQEFNKTHPHKRKIRSGVELFACFADRSELPRSRAVQYIGKPRGDIQRPERRRKNREKQYCSTENQSGNGNDVGNFFRKISSL